ncbi:Serine/threonine-protein kinase [Rhynchospora pubera]|uniref:non-specific serine/threonine protein kinase n=1 Tax=Rhynchospora pubera TaxID=906938 RepID=A0AAV8BQF2_9POAL|nr:Serine/threonine-protein kinase [Rhynchospora pubera]
MKKWPPLRLLPPLILTFFSLFSFSTCRDTITINSSLSAQETLVSSSGVFTLGFFPAGKYKYLGIWYTKISQQTVVWVANRDNPINDTSSVLTISSNGSNLQLQSSSNNVLWSTGISANLVNPFAQLLDTGNFVLKENNTDNIAWQSFDHPTDTMLPGLKVGFISGQYRNLVSWSGSDDPSSSNYKMELCVSGFPEFFLLDGLKRVYRNGPWIGDHFSTVPEGVNNGTFTSEYVSNNNETYYTSYPNNSSIVSRLVVNQSTIQRYVADTSGFQPESEKDWKLRDTSAGCIRQVELNFTNTKKNRNAGIIVTCVVLGLLFLASIVYLIHKKLRKNLENVAYMQRQRQISFESERPLALVWDKAREEGLRTDGNDIILPVFHASVISAATNNFALANKLGEGGFGTVFKGELEGGQRIAVKRLAKFSTQGLGEFKNEVILIAKLQHVNLVRLLGCSIEGEERMLVYEYMENKSLDTIIFNKARSSQLNWHKRFEIMKGIARGVLYLHEDSRFRIIHRDLKTSNVLLDENMNPKISDFGIARIFGGDEKKSHTNRVVGTYGYMSPEYAMDGVFSAWTLWKDGKALELLDSSISSNSNNNLQIMRCIQVGLLCVQDRQDDRPHMSEVVLMLNSLNTSLPEPKQPGYFAVRDASDMESSSSCMVIDMTVTVIEPR